MVKKIFKYLIILFTVFLVLYYVVYPFSMAFVATRSKANETGQPPANYSEINLKTSDNKNISAWYSKSQNGTTIILVHGAGGNKSTMKNYANFFSENGYGVLSLDLRGHGKSEGQTNMFGWDSENDIRAAVDFLKKQADTKTIAGFGSSMGGETLLASAYQNPAIKIIITDGATHRSFKDFMELRFTNRLIQETSYSRFLYKYTELLAREKQPTISLRESIARSEKTSFLFIAGDKPKMEIEYNQLFLKNANAFSDIWIANETGHTQAFSVHNKEFKDRILAFLKNNL